jgi:hypothetical protein
MKTPTLSFRDMEDARMAAAQRQAGGGKRPGQDTAPKKPAGRPQGEPSTIVNVRLPLTLVARLDRYLDRLEVQTGLKANRGMIARRAIELFLEAHETGDAR